MRPVASSRRGLLYDQQDNGGPANAGRRKNQMSMARTLTIADTTLVDFCRNIGPNGMLPVQHGRPRRDAGNVLEKARDLMYSNFLLMLLYDR